MKLERLEELKKISTKNLIVNEALKNLEDKPYYTKYELEVSLSLIILTLFGDTDIHKKMQEEDINWIEFIDDNFHLIEELKVGEYKDIYNELLEEISIGAKNKIKYNRSIASLTKDLSEIFSEENLKKMQETINKTGK